MTLATQAALGFFRHHEDLTALFLTALVFGSLLCAALFIYRRRGSQGFTTEPHGNHSGAPLRIIFAKWGIGGDAYRDVTEIVRRHCKPDAVNVPASVGLLGDPYPGAPKQLNVMYSFARVHWVEVKENAPLSLPEEEGKEYSRIETEKSRTRLATATRGASDPNRSYLESKAYTELSDEFFRLSWAKKVALKILIYHGIIDEANLRLVMKGLGFGPDDWISIEIIRGLRNCNLLEYKPESGSLRPNPARLRDVEEITADWNFEFAPRPAST
ncbi:MAG: hypothetical protein ABSB23_17355 [Bryobacteraceae bacterium]|jgi:hypothetical protein